MRRLVVISALVRLVVLAGCGDGRFGFGPREQYVQPSIAVMKFESRAAFPLRWDLGDGMRDILVDRLVATRRFHVVERPEIHAVLGELRFQNSGATRKQNRAAVGNLKNVEYLIKGTITDFGHVATNTGFLGLGGLSVFGGKNRAVMGLTLYVVDVESGEIVCSQSIQKSVHAGDLTVKAQYKNVGLGGSTFYRTPLGRATAKVIDEAVKQVSRHIAVRAWEPKIAKINGDGTILLSGGVERGVQMGSEYQVLAAPETIIDPDTGDIIGHIPGRELGRVRVARVHTGYSLADIIIGRTQDFKIGQLCRKIEYVAAR